MSNNSQTINISTSTIFRVVLILLGFFLLYLIRDILLMVFVAVIIAAAVNGPVNWLQKRRIPRLLGVIFLYLVFLLLLGLVITLIVPPLADQVKQLAVYFPEAIEKIDLNAQEWWGKYKIEGNLQEILSQFSDKLSNATTSVFGTIVGLFGGLLSAIVVVVISFYLATQEKGVKRFLVSLIPSEHRHYLSDLIDRIQSKIGGWLRGQLILMLIVGILVFIGLRLLGVKYALTLALIAGFLEIIPYIGPILSAIPATIITFFQSPFLALMVIILFTVVNQLENYVLIPQVMKRTVGLNPITIMIAMLIGAKLFGILGIILAVPVAAIIAEFFKDFQKEA